VGHTPVPHLIEIHRGLMVFFHLNLGLVSGLFRSDIPAKGEHILLQPKAGGLSEVLAPGHWILC